MVQTVLKSDSSLESHSDQTPNQTSESASSQPFSFILASILFWSIVILSLALLFPSQSSQDPALSRLSSEEFGIYYAFTNGLIWGKDIISQHGPLTILGSHLKTAEVASLQFLCHIFIWANLVWLVLSTAKKLSRVWQVCTLPVLAIGLNSGGFGKELPATLLTIALFHMFSCHQQPKGKATSLRFFLAGVCASLVFYMNIPTGIIALLCLAIYGTHIWVYEDRPAFFQVAVLGLGGLHLILNLTLPIHFGSVLFHSKEIIQGYNDSLFVPVGMKNWPLWLAGASLIFPLIALVSNAPKILKDEKAFLHTSITGIIVLMLFKQSFVRGDQEAQLYFHFLPIILGLLFINSSGTLRKMSGQAALLALTISAIILPSYQNVVTPTGSVPRILPPISKGHLDVIGTESVDVYPWGLNHTTAHQLTPSIRPTIQANLATTPRLELLNYRHFLSSKAPEFVLFHLNCLEELYCFGQESLTKWGLLRNYTVLPERMASKNPDVDALPSNPNTSILLQRKTIPSDQVIERVTLREADLGKWIDVPKKQHEYLYFKASTNYTLMGKLLAQLFKPAPLYLKIQLHTGQIYDYRITRQNLVTGIPIGVFVNSIEDAALFLTQKRTNLAEIKSFMLYTPYSSSFEHNYTLAFETWIPKESQEPANTAA